MSTSVRGFGCFCQYGTVSTSMTDAAGDTIPFYDTPILYSASLTAPHHPA